ncbi:MAG: hypothetical protein A2W27_02855 [Deltaproteobacteria bacterium RBG_16_44_11]|nr:MAG: hypothetical protein A2W27_02855 [Deltaproteobacteria bacterium RBG_16_44_11]
MGNRQTGPHSRDAYSYNAGNELLTSTGRIIWERDNQYEYDLNGNLIKKTQTIKNKWKLITTYAYDDENRLIEVKIQKGHKIKEVSFTYDPLGRRISKTVGRADFEDEDAEDDDKGKGKGKEGDKDKGKHGKPFQPRTTYYVYDDQKIIAEYDENNKLIASYVHGPNIDEPLSAEIRRDWVYYHADGLGSITTLTSHMGNVVQKYEYDSFGNMRPTPKWIKQPFTYTAREFDPETGLYYYRARYYDAKTGRFITRDPIGFDGGDVNLYVYVGNNAVNYTDPTGLELISVQEGLRIIAAGEKYIGTPYSVMDCSHFVNIAYNDAGFPYDYLNTWYFTSSPNFKAVPSCQAGDVALFKGHMGIYNPNPPKSGYYILSSTTSKGVRYGEAKWFGSPKGSFSCYRYDKDKCPTN